ncbi:MAG: hypothetical protein ACFE9C_13945, partial [Candidatus Hodarchaeota archaeon]
LVCYHKNIQNTMIFYRYTYIKKKFAHLNICGVFHHFFSIQKGQVFLIEDYIKDLVYEIYGFLIII